MPSPRTWNRREFNIAQNGYFTILKSSEWFSAVPLPGGFRYLVSKSKGTVAPQAHENPAAALPGSTSAPQQKFPNPTDIQQTTIRLQTIDSSTSGHHLIRLALIVVAATALTWIGLWCTAHP